MQGILPARPARNTTCLPQDRDQCSERQNSPPMDCLQQQTLIEDSRTLNLKKYEIISRVLSFVLLFKLLPSRSPPHLKIKSLYLFFMEALGYQLKGFVFFCILKYFKRERLILTIIPLSLENKNVAP